MESMKLSDGEKLILNMLCEIYEHMGVKGEIDHKLVQRTIWGGHGWGLKLAYPGIFDSEERDPKIVSEVFDILDMWSLLEQCYERLTADEKQKIKAEAAPLGEDVHFRGFDGNNETDHYGVALFAIQSLDRFTDFKGRDLNSHVPTIDAYRCMLTVFKPLRVTLPTNPLTASDLIGVLKARVHP